MKTNINKFCILFLLILSVSCSDFLQKDPPSEPSDSVFWLKKSDFESVLASCYSIMCVNEGKYYVISQHIGEWDALTDNINSTHGNQSLRTIIQSDLTPNTGGIVTNLYNTCYEAINIIHSLMEHLEVYEGTDMSQEEKNKMMAECKAMRGFYYHYLYQFYREVPLVLESLDLDNMYQPKASREAIYNQIMKDFDEALSVLDDLPYYNSSVTGHITPSAIKVFKTRLMIAEAYGSDGIADTQQMAEVLPILESITGYDLMDRMRDNFRSELQASSEEIIFSVRYLAPNITNSLDLFYGDWNITSVTRDLVDAFECTDGLEWGVSPLTVQVDEDLIYTSDGDRRAAMLAERGKLFINRDQRLQETTSHTGYYFFPEEEYAGDSLSISNPVRTGFNSIKFVQSTHDIIGYSTISDADVVLIRYAHVLLMIAEVENEINGPTNKAYNAINRVRNRSGQPDLPTGLSQVEFRERVRREWRVETAMEGLRYFQMRQWNILDKINGFTDPGESGYTKRFSSEYYYLPLPQSEIDKANGILVQDPNYI